MKRKRLWELQTRGGAYDGWSLSTTVPAPPPILILWRCGIECGGHATDNALDPAIVLATAEAYRRTRVDEQRRIAVYELGDQPTGPQRDERELVGAGHGLMEDAWL